ncbi:MAG TPA: thaumatin family protein [Gammaproteobacteria bacterium]|nr:thaumatin family protein [Gammaproteobacteria bacterium]
MKNKKTFFLFVLTLFFFFGMSAVKAATETGSRTFTFVNQCAYPVSFNFAGGSAENPKTKSVFCQTNNDCVTGSSCASVAPDRKICFWTNPTPADHRYELKTNESNRVIIPAYDNGTDTIWSGAVAGQTNCQNGVCETADCERNPNGNGACAPGHGFAQPATQAEFTLSRATDFYDVEVINGINIPMSMAPTNPAPETGNPYNCGSPGASSHPFTKTGVCSWDLTPPSDDYVWVRGGGALCTTSSNCPASEKCGLSFNPGHQPLLQKTCGVPLGFFTADEVCGIDSTFGAPFNCATRLPNSPTHTLTQLYMCAPIASCYQSPAQSDCCGCANWWQKGLDVPQSTKQCVSFNPYWEQWVEPGLEWIKRACPTAYVYPYDDMSSTFTCSEKDASQVNATAYTITFCPK